MKKLFLFIILAAGFLEIHAQPKNISFFNIFDGTFSTSSIANIEWMSDGEFYSTLDHTENGSEISKNSILNQKREVLVTDQMLTKAYPESGPIQRCSFSRDENKLLLQTDFESIWRRSSKANYYIYDLETGDIKKLTTSEDKQQYAELSPQGGRAAFVQHNNIYWVDLENGNEIAVTRDGKENHVINGAADWVYEEEFGFAKAWHWSPDGNKIAFYRFDESEVNDFYMTQWGNQYPEQVTFKYPKAGEQNSDVQIGIYDLASGETVWVDLSGTAYEYIPRINWTQEPGKLALRVMNRHQNRQTLLIANADNGKVTSIFTDKSDTWIDVHDDLHFLQNEREFIYTSDRDGFNHVYLYDLNGNEIRQITNGEWEVTELVGVDEAQEMIYYVSTEESPIERHLYKVGLDGGDKIKLSSKNGWNSMNMSPDFRFFIHIHSDANTPPTYTLRNSAGEEVRVLEENQKARQKLDNYSLPNAEFLELNLEEAGTLHSMMIRPPGFDPGKKYPMLVYVYGGPGSQTVVNSYRMGHTQLWHYFLASQGYIVVSIDGRGTGGRGSNFKKTVYKRLGKLETADQIEAASKLAELDYVDQDRVGIWGWSYGGFMSTLALAEGSDVFSAAVAVAPVTDWRYYDTIYTERYMQTPAENSEGYSNYAPVNLAGKIKGDYLIIHGTGDDNVHFQHATDMVDALVKQNIQFETMFYPNRNHGISGGSTRLHLYRLMTDFILEKL